MAKSKVARLGANAHRHLINAIEQNAQAQLEKKPSLEWKEFWKGVLVGVDIQARPNLKEYALPLQKGLFLVRKVLLRACSKSNPTYNSWIEARDNAEGMTLRLFKKKYNGAPYDLDEIADLAEQITDNEAVSDAASSFLEARQAFEKELERVKFELG